MVVYKDMGDGTIYAYSDRGMKIFGGNPEGMYSEAYDPKGLGRTYVETDEPVEKEPEQESESNN